ncbi:MAG TPA: hypothetical protein VGM66_04665 [Candidatus Udaeobacter sp.]
MQQLPSPDGRYVAYRFEANYGALDPYYHCVSILPFGQKPTHGGNVYQSSDVVPRFSWKSNSELFVVLWVSNPRWEVDRMEKQIGPIKISYKVSPIDSGYEGETMTKNGRLRHTTKYSMEGPFRTDTDYDEHGMVISMRQFDVEGNEIKSP